MRKCYFYILFYYNIILTVIAWLKEVISKYRKIEIFITICEKLQMYFIKKKRREWQKS